MTTDVAAGWSDDHSILSEHSLWRRIPGWHFVWDANRNAIRPSSAAFDNDRDGSPMSVQLAEVLVECRLDERHVLHNHRGFAIASFPAGAARNCGQGVARDARPGEPAHAVVFGEKHERVRRTLSKLCEWQTEPAALHLGDGCLLFEDRDGHPRVRRPNGRWGVITPGPPPDGAWLRVAHDWLRDSANPDAALSEAVARAVQLWMATAL